MLDTELSHKQIIRNIKLSLLIEDDSNIYKALYEDLEEAFSNVNMYNNVSEGFDYIYYGNSKRDIMFVHEIYNKYIWISNVFENKFFSDIYITKKVLGWYIQEKFNIKNCEVMFSFSGVHIRPNEELLTKI